MKQRTSSPVSPSTVANSHSPVWQYHPGAIIYHSEPVAEHDKNNNMEATSITETSGPLASTTRKNKGGAQ